jgi:hypothetical protein
MFRKKLSTIEPQDIKDDVLIQLSKTVEITKKTRVTVPHHYRQ